MLTEVKNTFGERGIIFSEQSVTVMNAIRKKMSGYVFENAVPLSQIVYVALRQSENALIHQFDVENMPEVGLFVLLMQRCMGQAAGHPLCMVLSNVDRLLLRPGMTSREIKGFLEMLRAYKNAGVTFLIGLSSKRAHTLLQDRMEELDEMKKNVDDFSWKALLNQAFGEAV